jgi:hypothetical protein
MKRQRIHKNDFAADSGVECVSLRVNPRADFGKMLRLFVDAFPETTPGREANPQIIITRDSGKHLNLEMVVHLWPEERKAVVVSLARKMLRISDHAPTKRKP